MQYDLSENDFAILDYIDQNPGANRATLFSVFTVSIEVRTNYLLKMGYIEDWRDRTSADDKAQVLGLFVVSAIGHAALEDYKADRTKQNIARVDNWRIAIFSVIGGSIAGLITSLLYLWLTN